MREGHQVLGDTWRGQLPLSQVLREASSNQFGGGGLRGSPPIKLFRCWCIMRNSQMLLMKFGRGSDATGSRIGR